MGALLTRRSIALALSCAALGASSTVAMRARADTQSCSAAAEEGQRARAAGELRRARKQLAICGAEDCPALIKKDCQAWASAVTESMPSIIVDAKDASGHDLADVTVTMDGDVLARALDGKAIDVDPGPHTFVFEHAGTPAVTEKVIIKERARGRTFTMKFGATAGSGAGTAMLADSPPPERHHTIWPWLVVGTGGAFIVSGVVLVATSPAFPTGCNKSTNTCEKQPNESDASFAKRQDDAGTAKEQTPIGLAVLAGGALIAAGGLLWHFLEPTGPVSTASLVPWTAPGAGGAVLHGTF